MLEDMKVFFENKMPWTKWPIKTPLYATYDQNKVKFVGSDKMRRIRRADGKAVFYLKNLNLELMPPSSGISDASGSVILVKTSEKEYKFATATFDEKTQALILSVVDDEQMKFLFAAQQETTARRFQQETPWQNLTIVGVIVMGVVIAGMYILSTSNLRGFDESATGLMNALWENTRMLNTTMNAVGSATQGATASGIRPPI